MKERYITKLPEAQRAAARAGWTYLAAATRVGDDCTLERVGGDHYAHLDPASEACTQMRAALRQG